MSPPDSPDRAATAAVDVSDPPASRLSETGTGKDRRRGGLRPRWWVQVLLIAGFYGLYTLVRDVRGSRPVSASVALHNAHRVIGLERSLGLFHEEQIQHALIGDRGLLRAFDDWYGSTHFLVTAGVLALLFFARPHLYRRWRNTIAVATGLALIGFAWFPLMPPRLLPASYGFVDTLKVIGGLWNFESGPMPHLSDQFAAMPSLHFAWALWCGAALWAMFQRWPVRLFAVVYPVVTLVCVIVTANHYFTDVAAGALTIASGYGVSRAVEWLRESRRSRASATPGLVSTRTGR